MTSTLIIRRATPAETDGGLPGAERDGHFVGFAAGRGATDDDLEETQNSNCFR